VLSLHARVTFVQSGGDVVLGELCLWSAFLPLGRCCSIDALRRRLQMYRTQQPSELAERERYAPDLRPVVSLGVLAVLLQFSFIYAFNALHKDGLTWREGSVVHYVLHQDRIVTGLGLWVRGWVTPSLSRAMTWSALAVEAALPLLLLSPVMVRYTRLAAIALVLLLHSSFALLMNLGIFGVAMVAYAPHFIPADTWQWLARRALLGRRERIVVYDGTSGVCFEIVRVLARLDTRGALQLLPSGDPSIATDVPVELLARTMVVIDPKTGRRWTRSDAVSEVFAALPGGAALAWCLRAPLIRHVANIAYDAFATRRDAISTMLGFSKRAVPSAAALSAAASAELESPFARGFGRVLSATREAMLAVALVLFASEIALENRVLHPTLWYSQPLALRMTIAYLQFWQGWSLFAPDAPRGDFNISVDAITRDGRHVDPFNELASPHVPHPGQVVAARLGQNSYFCVYVTRIARTPAYHAAFTEWILRYPQRTQRPEDEIRSFTAFFVEDASPAPSAREPRATRVSSFLSYP